MSDTAVADTRRLNSKPQDLTDAYGPPSNFLEIDIFNPQTVGVGRARFTTYEVRMRTNLPIFKLKESCVRRRYSDFEWLKNELERDSKIVVPPLPGKALKRQLPFRGDEGIFEESFIEERRQGLEQFINKIAGHPLAQNERCLHMFLQEEAIDRNYVPGKTTSAYCPALGWKSWPHDGLPGEEHHFSRRAYQIRDCGSIPCFWKLRSKKLSSLPRLSCSLFPTVRFSPGLSTFSACGPCPAPTSS
ncbi:sorting nexin-12 isoform X1 [Cervus elaphus]|uniref:sorting nexin-12 isoform X1 n=1 Tax=Cervus canadensis TaxID=1574408 RepID=UPI0018B9B9C2|nr:sorting nexin-12 isoform X1 [Cervus canadensis]XP_043751758.1 sorting nexin-12 isoform X1 [Cervus elaphus]